MKITTLTRVAALAALLGIAQSASAQLLFMMQPSGPPQPAQKAAPIDLTGYWVSVVLNDWRVRMMTAPVHDFDMSNLPSSPAGLKIANTFDRTKYGSSWTTQRIDCRAYYMAGLMRMPERLHISWASPDELQMQSDWGEQTRMIYFKRSDMPAALEQPSPQGRSVGEWQFPTPLGPGAFSLQSIQGGGHHGLPGGDLMVKTDHLQPGWLRRNGVPYSDKTTVTEYYQTFVVPPTGKTWFDVTLVVDDPVYLFHPYRATADFRQEPDGSKWAPHPCVNLPAGQ